MHALHWKRQKPLSSLRALSQKLSWHPPCFPQTRSLCCSVPRARLWSTTIPNAFLGAGLPARQTSVLLTPAPEQGGTGRGHAVFWACGLLGTRSSGHTVFWARGLLGTRKAAAPRALLSARFILLLSENSEARRKISFLPRHLGFLKAFPNHYR